MTLHYCRANRTVTSFPVEELPFNKYLLCIRYYAKHFYIYNIIHKLFKIIL